jgi:hypothetical protein
VREKRDRDVITLDVDLEEEPLVEEMLVDPTPGDMLLGLVEVALVVDVVDVTLELLVSEDAARVGELRSDEVLLLADDDVALEVPVVLGRTEVLLLVVLSPGAKTCGFLAVKYAGLICILTAIEWV